METTRDKKSKAVVFVAGGDQALAQAIADGVMSSKFTRCTEKLQRENETLQNKVDFWKTMHHMRRQQVFETSINTIHNAEARTSWEYINTKTCLFFGFVAGILFEVLLTTVVML